MKKLSIIFLLTAGLVLAACPFKKDDVPKGAFTGGLPNKVAGATAAGIRVQSNQPIDANLLPLIDQGYAAVTERASAVYGKVPTATQYTVGLWPRSDRCINPGFLVPGLLAWDQTDFDKDRREGKVLLCVVGLAPAYASSQGGILTPDSTYGVLVVADASIIAAAVDAEFEHEILFARDVNRWLATAGVHAHPLIGSSLKAAFGEAAEAHHVKWTPELNKLLPLPKRKIVRENAFGETAEEQVDPVYCVIVTK